MEVKMDRDLPKGVGICLDAWGREIARMEVPGRGAQRPEGARTLLLSVEDYGRFLSMAAQQAAKPIWWA